jgi:DNA-binding IclR family transcriptional regulator
MTIVNVDRALDVIEALAERPEGMPLVSLATQLGLPKSAAHRLLESLGARGYVVQDPSTHHYQLSMKLSTLGFRILDARWLPDHAQGVLDRLAREAGEYCRLTAVENGTLHWVARAQGATQGLRYDPPMGRDVALHATASGKAWLATLPEDDALAIVARRGLQRRPNMGPRASRSLDEVRRHLRETRRRGYATAVDEAEAGIVAVAVAFRAALLPDAPAMGTISIAGPAIRLNAKRAEALAPSLAEAAREMTELWPMRQRQAALSAAREALPDAA